MPKILCVRCFSGKKVAVELANVGAVDVEAAGRLNAEVMSVTIR